MPGMKRDCGGAAAILGAFKATIKQVRQENCCIVPCQRSLSLVCTSEVLCLEWMFSSLQGFKDNLHAVFCLAENSVGPTATRPDDIHTLYSGKWVFFFKKDLHFIQFPRDGILDLIWCLLWQSGCLWLMFEIGFQAKPCEAILKMWVCF